MLFSNDEVAKFLSETYECAWESVRPVPKAEIDFGNGIRLTRTLQGNVATYFCTQDGRVVDIVPGLATPEEYLRRARLANLLLFPGRPDSKLIGDYHRSMAEMLKDPEAMKRLGLESRMADMRKSRVENPLKLAMEMSVRSRPRTVAEDAAPDYPKDRVERPVKSSLETDTEYNMTVRMPKVHALLAEKPLAKPSELKAGLFRDILGYDIEDPYLGLAPYVLGGEGGRTESRITKHE